MLSITLASINKREIILQCVISHDENISERFGKLLSAHSDFTIIYTRHQSLSKNITLSFMIRLVNYAGFKHLCEVS